MNHAARLAAAREAMLRAGVEAMLVSGMANIRYLSGFTGSNGLVVIGPERATLLTDFRYQTASEPLPNAVLFPRLIPMAWSGNIQTSLHSGVLLALLAVPLVYGFLFRTPVGFELRVLGQNAEAARVARYATDRLRLLAMTLSGALCGLAGVIELLGSGTGSLPATSFAEGVGFTAIPVALLGGLNPVGALFSALFFGALTQGCRNLEQTQGVASVLIYIVQATAVLAVVGARAWQNRRGSETE